MSANRAKGTAWESQLVGALAGRLTTASLNVLDTLPDRLADVWRDGIDPDVRRTGSADLGGGDLILPAFPDLLVEAKAHKRMELAAWVDQAVRASARQGYRVPAVIHKRPRANVLDGYVTLPLWAFGVLLRRTDG